MRTLKIDDTKEGHGPSDAQPVEKHNRAYVGSEQQPIHRDAVPLWSEISFPHPAITLVVSISPIVIAIDCGSMEIWPGSHQHLGVITEEQIELQRDIMRPMKLDMK